METFSDKPVLCIDGDLFDDFAGFTREVTQLLCHCDWHGNLDAFNDILRGGFGTPDGGWTLRWLNSERSRAVLGYEATVQWLEELLPRVYPSNLERFRERIRSARGHEGPTLFDEIVEIIRDHGLGGQEEEDGIVLELV